MSFVLATYNRAGVEFTKGDGCYLTASNGETYLDFAAGIAVNALGHCHPQIVAALKDQAEKLWHVSNLYPIAPQEALAEKLASLSKLDRFFFCNSGAEANECAIKMARKFHHENGHSEKYRVITIDGGFHGRTLATLAAGNKLQLLTGFGPKVDGFDQAPYGDLDALEALITKETAAIMVEPIQGEGGVRVLEAAYLKAMRALCDKHDLLLIFDEVQTGIGRTGQFFAFELSGVRPDILSLAKGLGAGFPIGACGAVQKVAEAMGFGSHGSTFGGNYLASVVALKTIELVCDKAFLAHVRDMNSYFTKRLNALHNRFGGVIKSVNGEGLMLGLQLSTPPADLVKAALAEKLLTVPAGNQVMRLLPPLIADKQQFDEAIEKLEKAFLAIA